MPMPMPMLMLMYMNMLLNKPMIICILIPMPMCIGTCMSILMLKCMSILMLMCIFMLMCIIINMFIRITASMPMLTLMLMLMLVIVLMLLLNVCGNINCSDNDSVDVSVNLIVYGNISIYCVCDVLRLKNKPSILRIGITFGIVNIFLNSDALKFATFLPCFCFFKSEFNTMQISVALGAALVWS